MFLVKEVIANQNPKIEASENCFENLVYPIKLKVNLSEILNMPAGWSKEQSVIISKWTKSCEKLSKSESHLN